MNNKEEFIIIDKKISICIFIIILFIFDKSFIYVLLFFYNFIYNYKKLK